MKIRKFEFDLKEENCFRIYWHFDKISAISRKSINYINSNLSRSLFILVFVTLHQKQTNETSIKKNSLDYRNDLNTK